MPRFVHCLTGRLESAILRAAASSIEAEIEAAREAAAGTMGEWERSHNSAKSELMGQLDELKVNGGEAETQFELLQQTLHA